MASAGNGGPTTTWTTTPRAEDEDLKGPSAPIGATAALAAP